MNLRDREAFAPGVDIDGFRLEEQLSGGAATFLWRVTRSDSAAPLVLKVLRAGADPAAMVSFDNERLVLPRLSGPHVPDFVAAGVFSALPYLVTELVSGPSLHDRFASVMFSADAVAGLGVRIATALADIHRQHVVHLDVQPRSVIFRKPGEAVLVGFGLAHHAGLPDLIAGQFLPPPGNAVYMAPEQVVQVRTDPRSDIFALGAILYHLIAGRPPFGYPVDTAGLRRRLYRDPAPPGALNPSCPDWLEAVIIRCLEVDPARRFPDAAQVSFLLRHPGKYPPSRSARGKPGGFLAALVRRLPSRGGGEGGHATLGQGARVTTVMVAVDLASGSEPLAEALRTAVRRSCESRGAVRLLCITVLPLCKVGAVDAGAERFGLNPGAQLLAELKHWALPLGLPPEQISFHILEAADPVAALIGYAKENRVDHVVIGARGGSGMHRPLDSVLSRVVAEVRSTVTIAREHSAASGTSGVSTTFERDFTERVPRDCAES